MGQMKIGLVCPYNVALGGGVQEVVFALQRHLSQRGHSVKIITARPRRLGHVDTSNIIFLGGAIDVRWPNHTTAPLSSGISMEAIDQMVADEQFDILHFHEPWVPALSRQILARSRSVNIATFHAKVPETIINRTLARVVTPYLRTVLSDLHGLTAVSEAAAEYVSSLTDRPITLIPNGIELERYAFRGRDAAGSPKTILFVGRLEARKGVRFLLQAYHLLSQDEEDVRLIIAGNGPERKKLEALVAALNIPNVAFTGYVTDDEKRTLLAEADLFCSPALYGESFGIVLLEAMATGIVSVAGNNSGYEGLLQELGAVSLVNPKDITEFARRMKLLLTEPKLRSLWQSWAQGYVQQFAYDRVVDQYEQLYKAALDAHTEMVGHGR